MGNLARSAGLILTRLAFAALLLVTSVYCLLLYIPFTYFGFIHNPLLWWLPLFVRLHPILYGITLAGVIATLVPDAKSLRTRRSAIAFIIMQAGIALFLLFRPALATMMRDLFAYIWSMLCLFPLAWVAALDLESHYRISGAAALPTKPLKLSTAVWAGCAAGLLFAATSLAQHLIRHSSWEASPLDVGATVAVHVVLFSAFGLGVIVSGTIAGRTASAGDTRFILVRILAWAVIAGTIRYVITPTISFDGLQANLYAAAVSAVIVLYFAGLECRLRSAWAGRAPRRDWLGRAAVLVIPALVLWAYAIPIIVGPTDWDFVIQKVSVLLVWAALLIGFSLLGDWRTRLAKASAILVLLLCGGSLVAYRAVMSSGSSRAANWSVALETYAGSDISFKTGYDILSRSVDDEAYSAFYSFLRHHTNLGPEAVVAPADIRLVDSLQPVAGNKPNIFFFVIDSLRQDFVSPYNPAVDFSPEIAKFAKDSVVMPNAFTRYAGTALSEPAIWVGAMQLHKQYIQPFAPMNSLQKLLQTDGYRSYISMDPILQATLVPSPDIIRLDEGNKLWNDLDFCVTLKELETKIDARADRRAPTFAYTQPQNVHTLTLERQKLGGSRREISAAEVRRMDSAFGEFLQFLKQRGLYDNSIIILTSDHGDSYGEFGRYGHADFLFPEIIRIPLIIHLPESMRRQYVVDEAQPVFSLDITPSLYYLLGHRPILNQELYGRPLFTETLDEQVPYRRQHYLIASSYAAVYGILGGTGKSLFIVDAVNHKNYFFDLTADPLGVHNRVTPRLRDQNEPLIRRQLELIDRLYHYSPPS
jgi:hypothetical protein